MIEKYSFFCDFVNCKRNQVKKVYFIAKNRKNFGMRSGSSVLLVILFKKIIRNEIKISNDKKEKFGYDKHEKKEV